MNRKWIRYVAMGIAFVMALVLLLTLVVPYLNL